ncbi:MAG: hypothetical protein L0Y58_13075 [Verrucomicrobia subdivision 3 bacterium]|nr:hypothetical protein [Limisphaerales bacterium]
MRAFLNPRQYLGILAGALLATAATANAQWAKHFRIGMQLGLNIDADFSSGGTFGVSGNNPGSPGPDVDHIYDDGYVRMDATGNAGDLTTFWGYRDASQIQGNNERMRFHATESYTLTGNGSTEEDDDPYFGFEAAYGGPITRWGKTLIGWEVGYGLLPIEISDKRTLTGTAVRGVFEHDLGGIFVPPPPYDGSETGEQQPTIGAGYNRLTDTLDNVSVTGSRTLDVTMHNIRAGPTIHWEFAPRWALEGSAGGALGIVTGDYRFKETLNFQSGGSTQSRGDFGETDFVYGAYVTGLVLFHVEQHGDIYAGVQFMTLSDSEFEKDGRSAELNLGAAISFLVGINWPF